MDYFFRMALSLVLETLKEIVKNPAKKEELRKAMMKVSKEIAKVYADDEEFLESVVEIGLTARAAKPKSIFNAAMDAAASSTVTAEEKAAVLAEMTGKA